MKKHMILAAIAMAVLPLSANAASVTTRGGYEYDKNQLSDASVLDYNIDECSHFAITQDEKTRFAKYMGVSEANVRHEYCRRFLTAYAKGAIPYDDYVQYVQKHVAAPSILKALKIAGSGPAKPQGRDADIVIPVSAKMDSGETFKGSTIASRAGGHFLVRSSRHSVKCSGTYNPRDRHPILEVPVKCSDGRTGEADVTRSHDLMSGYGKVKLSDGSTGRLIVGTGQ